MAIMAARSMTRDPAAMDGDAVARLSSLLASAHSGGHAIAASDVDTVRLAPDDAYRVQAAVAQNLGRTVGWKVGRKTPAGDFAYAPLFENRLYPSGMTLAGDAFRVWHVEAELMVRFGQGLPRRGRPYGRDEVVEAIDQVMAAIEIIDSRFAAWPDVAPALLLADLLSHGAMVVGSGIPLPADTALERAQIRLTIGGDVVIDQVGGNPAGDLVDLVTVLANRLTETGAGIRAGDLVTTGSFTGMRLLPPATRAEAAFAGIGSVALARGA